VDSKTIIACGLVKTNTIKANFNRDTSRHHSQCEL